MKYIVTLEVDTKGSDKHPEEWFWTDACPSPDDGVTFIQSSESDE